MVEELAVDRGHRGDAQGVALAAPYSDALVERGAFGVVQLGGAKGADLRELVGREYLAVGTSVHSGDYRARTANGQSGVFSVGPAAPGSNEYTLDQVRNRDFYVDQRAARRTPGVGAWLDTARPTYVIPGRYPNNPTPPLALRRAFDIVVHLHTVRASVPLPPTE
ncbi:hypothetical protein Sros01_79990 [Streptomyces roseochromogenus]|nr:hypothetical protein Sros01_79990 [Streptomyces roseochromogenus]